MHFFLQEVLKRVVLGCSYGPVAPGFALVNETKGTPNSLGVVPKMAGAYGTQRAVINVSEPARIRLEPKTAGIGMDR